MASLLLAIIYIAFVSLGLPDSVFGASWPIMQPALGVPLSYAGIITMIIAGGTVCSSLMSDWLTKKLGTGAVTAISVAFTAFGLFGFSFVKSFAVLCVIAVPYGLGAGAIDAALNNYVAVHYSSRQMTWLHCCWGVGASISPYIIGAFLAEVNGWQSGYRAVSYIQMGITAILFASLPLWKRLIKSEHAPKETPKEAPKKGGVFKIKGVTFVLLAFLGYCGLETTAGLWASSYLVLHRGVSAETAAQFASLFYIGITAGRFLCGFITNKVGDKNMIRLGLAVIIVGIVAVVLPLETNVAAYAGLVVIGVGCAPIYPCIIHSTPYNFGEENSQKLIGIQMAFAYIGSTFMPPLFGLIAQNISIGLYPEYLMVFAVLMIVMTELLNAKLRKNKGKGISIAETGSPNTVDNGTK